jgi:beta-N-acetylhexosaminidase
VLDVGTDDAAFIGARAFATDARRVAELGLAFAAGLTAAGVLPCGKHFPGHGATATDSHHERPVVTCSRAEILERELVPFRAAAAARVPMLMSGHVVYPALDPDRVATLSSVIATTLLRRDIGFRGALWSDDLSMRAVSDYLTIPDAAVAAIVAGVDGVLIVHDLELGRRARQHLLAAVESGMLPAQRLREAAQRIASVPARRAPAPLELPCDAHAELAERVRVMAATQRA